MIDVNNDISKTILKKIEDGINAGDFDEFNVEEQLEYYKEYYEDEE